jgi:hypothetical protein
MIASNQLVAFVRESNKIEGINRDPTLDETEATRWFLGIREPSVDNLTSLVSTYQPDAVLRTVSGLNVRVGYHIAPEGGKNIIPALEAILSDLRDPWETHRDYETLHPFTDGNGRSGRTLWAWMMVRRQNGLPLGFLHQFYYQTLERSR